MSDINDIQQIKKQLEENLIQVEERKKQLNEQIDLIKQYITNDGKYCGPNSYTLFYLLNIHPLLIHWILFLLFFVLILILLQFFHFLF